MGILSWIIVGLVGGAIAGLITGRKAEGCLRTMLVGILGALLGGALFNAAGEKGVDEFGAWSIFVAIIGASVLLLLFDGLAGGKRGRRW